MSGFSIFVDCIPRVAIEDIQKIIWFTDHLVYWACAVWALSTLRCTSRIVNLVSISSFLPQAILHSSKLMRKGSSPKGGCAWHWSQRNFVVKSICICIWSKNLGWHWTNVIQITFIILYISYPPANVLLWVVNLNLKYCYHSGASTLYIIYNPTSYYN